MRLPAVERKARGLEIKETWKFSKEELIRKIQVAEGFDPCFKGIDRKGCRQSDCCWRGDCIR
ncbi:MAG: SAP domain-containing protein [Candidatus Omnitrophica bacterium]|nr:SAP domain-containing protein [Candidatus Omnitrophota bacterium]